MIDESILNECYDLAARYVKSDAAKDILKSKSQKINYSQSPFVPTSKSSHIISETLYKLSREQLGSSQNTEKIDYAEINALPFSAEKEFLLALLSLRNGTGESQRLEANRHIVNALNSSPNDPRYIALAEILTNIK